MFSAWNGASLDLLWLRVMTSWRVKVASFLRKNEISINTFKCSGIMENWIKHELFHLNNKISWWYDMTHDNMSSHNICHMTSRHDFIRIKYDIWLLQYVAVSELERWFYFHFARYLGRKIHSNYRRLGDFQECIYAWPWNWKSRHGLRELFCLCLYLSYRDDFFCFVMILGQKLHSNYRRLRGPHAWPWNWMSRHGLRDICHFCLYLCYRNDFFVSLGFESGNSF